MKREERSTLRPGGRAMVALAGLALAAACGSNVALTERSATQASLGSGLDDLAGAGTSAPEQSPSQATTTDVPSADDASGAQVDDETSGTQTAAPTTTPTTGAARSLVNLPGVTASTFTVGVIASDPSTNETLDNAGFSAASTGDEPAAWKAMADEINAKGGIAGRKLALVFHLLNLTDSPSTQGQAACERFTQDTKVAVVVSGYYYSSAHECLSAKGIPSLLGTNYGVDAIAARQNRTVVSWATPLLDRIATTLPDAFAKLGALKKGTTAGILVTDSAPFTRSAAKLGAALSKRGVKVVTQVMTDSSTGDYGAQTGDASSAVLRFRSAGVTEVLFLTHNAFEPTLMMQVANSQSYLPRYLISTQQYPQSLTGLVPARQLERALAVGWAPAVDLRSGFATSPAAKACLTVMKRHGRTFNSGTQTLVGLLACDGLDLLRRATLQKDALASLDALRQAALSGSTGFVSASTLRTAFPNGRSDGIAAYQLASFASGCKCFTYTGSPVSW